MFCISSVHLIVMPLGTLLRVICLLLPFGRERRLLSCYPGCSSEWNLLVHTAVTSAGHGSGFFSSPDVSKGFSLSIENDGLIRVCCLYYNRNTNSDFHCRNIGGSISKTVGKPRSFTIKRNLEPANCGRFKPGSGVQWSLAFTASTRSTLQIDFDVNTWWKATT